MSGRYELKVAKQAQRDLDEISDWSRESFGLAASKRYENLVEQAFRDLRENPLRPGVRSRMQLPGGACLYHLASSREHVAGPRVGAPRHWIVFRRVGTMVIVLRILHESRDLARHLNEEE